ncbi:type IV pilus modification PilV family protein [Hydrogenimonas thermophila]|uniref:type IV pilus modification PilV family protein n=1 Tax=Hydrogenimonas thermophila TaxID=223786 RepID=UPI0037430801
MRPAFTLMEVMVAVLIISVTLGAMLQITHNAGFIYERGKNRSEILPRASLAFSNPLEEHPSENIDIKSIAESFGVKDDDILDILRKAEPKLESELYSQIDLSEMDDDENEEMLEEDDATQNQSLSIDIYRLVYKEKDGNAVSIFRLKLLNGINKQ